MSAIEERVVAMKFDNAQFEQKIQSTLRSLEALNKSLQLQGAANGLNNVAAAGKNVQLGHIASGVESLSNRFRAMSVVAVSGLVAIAHKAASAGISLVKSLTIDPVLKGLREYETNLNSIQTIMANTGREGKKGLGEVNAALDELNHYSDQTIYNFSEMAKNIGTFTAAGVKLEVATSAIKGIANLAALSGSNSQQASAAMYQLSQAISAGKVSLEDWNSVVNAGMGGKVFQNALMQTARVHGVAIDQMVKDAGSFRLTLQEGWLTGEILTETLSQFTGDLNAAQLKTMGYNDKQIAGILKMARIAKAAATEVKTASQLIGTLQEAAGSGWAKTWQLIFGDFDEAKKLWTGVNQVLGGFIERSADARNKVVGDWKALGGRTVLIEAIGNAFKALISIITPIRDAFRQMFPATTGKQLYDMTVSLRDFTEKLKMGGENADKLKRTFAGVFAIFGIGWDILKEVAKTLFSLFGVASKGSGSFLDITASIGDFLVGVREAINKGDALSKVFKVIGAVLALPIKLIGLLVGLIGSLVDGFDGGGDSVGKFTSKLEPMSSLGGVIAKVWQAVVSTIRDVIESFGPMSDKLSDFFSGLGDSISSALEGMNFGDILASINTGLFAGLILLLRNFIGNLGGGGGGILANLSDAFENLSGALGAMQNTLRAATLLQIALAVGILALAMNTLSKIDAAGLTRASAAIAGMFTQLIAALLIFEKFSGFVGFAKMPFVATSMILLGVAINILASAVKKLADLNWGELAKGLVGTTVLLGALVAVAKFMPPGAGLISTGLGMIVLAGAIRILVGAVTQLSGLSWNEMAKGLISVGVLLGSLALFTKFTAAAKGGLIQGAGIILLATGIKILASSMDDLGSLSWGAIAKGLVAMAGGLVIMGAALLLIPPTSIISAAAVLVVAASLGMLSDALQSMGKMSWGEIGKGMVALAGALLAIGLALTLIPPTAPLTAAGILIVAASLGMIADALKDMAQMSWGEIAKGLVALAGALGIISIAMIAMTGALSGAAALIVVAMALRILAPVLQLFGDMSWGEMIKGLLMLAGVFVVIGAAGVLLTPVVGTLIALGVAITLLGVGMMAAGAGVFLFAAGLTALSVAGAAGAAAIVGIVSGLASVIPNVMKQIGLGILAFAKVIATAGPAMTKAMTTVLLAIIAAINKTAPKIVDTLLRMLLMMLQTMNKYVPRMVDAGLKLLVGILNGVSRNIGRVVSSATSVIVAFLNGISRNQGRVVQAGVNMIIKFVNGVAAAIRRNSSAMGAAGANLGMAIVEGMIRGIAGGIGAITAKARSVARSALDAAKRALGISSPSKEFFKIGMYTNEGMANGLDKYKSLVENSADGVGRSAITSFSKSISGLSDIIDSGMDVNPTITPVLDLSNVKNGARRIGNWLEIQPISVGSSYSRAKGVSDARQSSQSAIAEEVNVSNNSSLTFNQYNNSPKALTSAEIYRQTKNQLSVAKGALASNVG